MPDEIPLVILSAPDVRQSPGYATYMRSIGWIAESIEGTQVFIRQTFLGSVIKIQHPVGLVSLDAVDQIAKKYKALSVNMEPQMIGYDEEALMRAGYIKNKLHFAPSATARVDLRLSEQELLNSFSENARRNLKKVAKNGIVIKTVFLKDGISDSLFEDFFHLYNLLSQSKHFYSPPRKEIYDKILAFNDNSFMTFAYYNNKAIAVVWYAGFEKTLYYMHTGINADGYSMLANYALVWEGMKVGKSLGMEVLDFEGIYDSRNPGENKKWLGFSEFKLRFHPYEIYYPLTWVKFYNPIFKGLYVCGTLFSP